MRTDRRTQVLSVYIAMIACVLSTCSMLGENANKLATRASIEAANAFAWYQAKTIRELVDKPEMQSKHKEDRARLEAEGKRYLALRDKALRLDAYFDYAQLALNTSLAIAAAAILTGGALLPTISFTLATLGVTYMVIASQFGFEVLL